MLHRWWRKKSREYSSDDSVQFKIMKRTFLIVVPIIGLAVGLSVVVGGAWYFMRQQNNGSTAIRGAAPETEPIDAEAGPAGGPAGRNNARAAKFETLDIDRDGKLNLAEFTGDRKPAEAAKWFERRDMNHDGFISREEFLPFSAGPKPQ
jgi:hypothetical protein